MSKQWVDHPRVALDIFNRRLSHYLKAEILDQWMIYFTGLKTNNADAFLSGQWVATREKRPDAGLLHLELDVSQVFGRSIYYEDLKTHDGSNEVLHRIHDVRDQLLETMKVIDATH